MSFYFKGEIQRRTQQEQEEAEGEDDCDDEEDQERHTKMAEANVEMDEGLDGACLLFHLKHPFIFSHLWWNIFLSLFSVILFNLYSRLTRTHTLWIKYIKSLNKNDGDLAFPQLATGWNATGNSFEILFYLLAIFYGVWLYSWHILLKLFRALIILFFIEICKFMSDIWLTWTT